MRCYCSTTLHKKLFLVFPTFIINWEIKGIAIGWFIFRIELYFNKINK